MTNKEHSFCYTNHCETSCMCHPTHPPRCGFGCCSCNCPYCLDIPVKTSGTGGGTHSVLGEPTKTFSKTKLLEWVRQQQKNTRVCFTHDITKLSTEILHAQLDSWNLLTEAIEAGDFDE